VTNTKTILKMKLVKSSNKKKQKRSSNKKPGRVNRDPASAADSVKMYQMAVEHARAKIDAEEKVKNLQAQLDAAKLTAMEVEQPLSLSDLVQPSMETHPVQPVPLSPPVLPVLPSPVFEPSTNLVDPEAPESVIPEEKKEDAFSDEDSESDDDDDDDAAPTVNVEEEKKASSGYCDNGKTQSNISLFLSKKGMMLIRELRTGGGNGCVTSHTISYSRDGLLPGVLKKQTTAYIEDLVVNRRVWMSAVQAMEGYEATTPAILAERRETLWALLKKAQVGPTKLDKVFSIKDGRNANYSDQATFLAAFNQYDGHLVHGSPNPVDFARYVTALMVYVAPTCAWKQQKIDNNSIGAKKEMKIQVLTEYVTKDGVVQTDLSEAALNAGNNKGALKNGKWTTGFRNFIELKNFEFGSIAIASDWEKACNMKRLKYDQGISTYHGCITMICDINTIAEMAGSFYVQFHCIGHDQGTAMFQATFYPPLNGKSGSPSRKRTLKQSIKWMKALADYEYRLHYATGPVLDIHWPHIASSGQAIQASRSFKQAPVKWSTGH
jgi:hypothetical protein